MLVGSLLISNITSKLFTWTFLLMLLSIHLGTNYLAVRAVCMRTFNRQRANLVLSSVLDDIENENEIDNDREEKEKSAVRSEKAREKLSSYVKVPTIQSISAQERIFERDGVIRWKNEPTILCHARIGVPLQRIISCFHTSSPLPVSSTGSLTGPAAHSLHFLLAIFAQTKFLIWYDWSAKTFLIVLKEAAQTRDQIVAWMVVLYIARWDLGDLEVGEGVGGMGGVGFGIGGGKGGRDMGGGRERDRDRDQALLEVLEETMRWVEGVKEEVLGLLEGEGWDLEGGALETVSGTRLRVGDRDGEGRKVL